MKLIENKLPISILNYPHSVSPQFTINDLKFASLLFEVTLGWRKLLGKFIVSQICIDLLYILSLHEKLWRLYEYSVKHSSELRRNSDYFHIQFSYKQYKIIQFPPHFRILESGKLLFKTLPLRFLSFAIPLFLSRACTRWYDLKGKGSCQNHDRYSPQNGEGGVRIIILMASLAIRSFRVPSLFLSWI